MTAKNGTLGVDDLVLEGDCEALIIAITQSLDRLGPGVHRLDIGARRARVAAVHKRGVRTRLGESIAASLGRVLAFQRAPIVVDDSQIFGGLIAASYAALPDHVRIVGDHSGSIGSGIGYATGVAAANPSSEVWCFLGDQGFLNGSQALACIGELQLGVKIVVCNNGGSVSLRTQIAAQDSQAFDAGRGPFLGNGPNVSVVDIAKGFGVSASSVSMTTEPADVVTLDSALTVAASSHRPYLLEIITPSDLAHWHGAWATKGLDE
jgi:acetolactate synthase-1/2/3 large subunit